MTEVVIVTTATVQGQQVMRAAAAASCMPRDVSAGRMHLLLHAHTHVPAVVPATASEVYLGEMTDCFREG